MFPVIWNLQLDNYRSVDILITLSERYQKGMSLQLADMLSCFGCLTVGFQQWVEFPISAFK